MLNKLFGYRSLWNLPGFPFGQVAPFIEKLFLSSLNEHQTQNRFFQIADNSTFLLGDGLGQNSTLFWNAKSDEGKRLVKSRLEMVSSLFDLGTEQIAERASIISTYFENKLSGYNVKGSSELTGPTYSEILKNASSLDNRTLESRLAIIKSQLDILKFLAGIKHERETWTATIIPQKFTAYATGLTLNNEDLVNRFDHIKGLFKPKSAEPTNNFMDFLELYKIKISLSSGDAAVGASSSTS